MPQDLLDALQSWAFLNNIKLNGVKIESHVIGEDGVSKGGGIVALNNHEASSTLMTIPQDLVLNKTSIKEAARTDQRLREVLEAVGPTFSQTPRTAIMVFLLVQLTYSSPDFEKQYTGMTAPLADYVKTLPKNVPLPTVYSMSERELLAGTSLDAAVEQKIKRLETEFDHLVTRTQSVDWCNNLWWTEDEGALTLHDWKMIDAMYRSRALELPYDVGDSMVPVLDMANHASDDKYNARFEINREGHVELVVRDNMSIVKGEEITIMYGCGGACEMVFSYGFIEKYAQSAREMFLDLKIEDDDPLKRAKIAFAKESPGVRLFTDSQGSIHWESSFVWWACINEEDGLEFQLLQQVDGSRELKATWKGAEFEAGEVRKVLMADPLWDIFLLRATVLIQNRVESQGIKLSLSQESFENIVEDGDDSPVVDTVSRLRSLEIELLAASYQALEVEKARSLDSDIVRMYLNKAGPDRSDGAIDDDFS